LTDDPLTTYGKNPPDDYSDSQKRIHGLADSCGCEMKNAAAGPTAGVGERDEPVATGSGGHDRAPRGHFPKKPLLMAGTARSRRTVIPPRPPAEAAGAMTVQSTAYLVNNVTVVKVRGRIETDHLESWANMLEIAELLGQGLIVIDLHDLEHWSITAQSLLLIAARGAARQGRVLALCRPNAALRSDAAALRVVDRVTTYPDASEAAARLRLPSGWTEPPNHADVSASSAQRRVVRRFTPRG
jgi:anti-anti-sigma regulatory factor